MNDVTLKIFLEKLQYNNTQIFTYIDNKNIKHDIPVQKVLDYIQKNNIKPIKMKPNDFDVIDLVKDIKRVDSVDLNFPIIVDPGFSNNLKNKPIKYGIVDGVHRIRKAQLTKQKYINVILVNVDKV